MLNLVKNAKFLFHPTIIDNGTFSVLEAASVGVPSLSSDYPPMRSLDEIYKLNLLFFDPNSKARIATAIKEMSQNYAKFAAKLPSIAELCSINKAIEKNSGMVLLNKIRGML